MWLVIRCFMPRVPTYLTVPAAKQETLDMLELQIQLFWEVDEVIIIQLRTHLVFWLPLMGTASRDRHDSCRKACISTSTSRLRLGYGRLPSPSLARFASSLQTTCSRRILKIG